jgi:branched-chain amino acid transport system substrate-binding protein
MFTKPIKFLTLITTVVSALTCTGAFAADPVRIGFVESLTGPFSVNGNATAFAVEAEVAKINASGGLLGRQIVLVTRDSASDPSKALAVTNGLLFNDNIDVLMGPGSSGEAFPMMDVVAGAKKLFVTPTQADPLIDPVKRPLTFRGMPTLSAVAARTVQFTSDTLKKKKIVIFADSTGYGTNVADLLKSEYEKSGIKPLSVVLINVNQADVTQEMNKARATGADLVEVWTSATGLMARILNARGEIAWTVPVAGHTNLIGKEVKGLVDKPEYLNDVYAITYSNSVYDDSGKLPPKSQEFVDLVGKRIETQSGAPLFAAMIGAGMVQIYAEGVKKANSFDPEKIKAALESMGPFTTAFGTFNYNKADHTGFALGSMEFVKAGSDVGYGNARLKLR